MYVMIVYFCCLDNVCIESMSIKITRRTLDKCQQNIDGLSKQIQRYKEKLLEVLVNSL